MEHGLGNDELVLGMKLKLRSESVSCSVVILKQVKNNISKEALIWSSAAISFRLAKLTRIPNPTWWMLMSKCLLY